MNPTPDRAARRRGVLMLVVVSMLTLFLMLGTTYLVVAVRARQAARAQARLAMELTVVKPSSLLDAVLLKVVRGDTKGISLPLTTGSVGLPGVTPQFEAILADKYGSSVSGSATAISDATTGLPSLVTATITTNTTSGLESLAHLPGRVLTLLGPGRDPTSHRILYATGTITSGTVSATVTLDKPNRRRPIVLPSSSGTVPIVINGFEFDDTNGNEPYDAFDGKNIFLSHIVPADSSATTPSVAGSQVKKLGYVSSGTAAVALSESAANGFSLGADNDNDGQPDGLFLNFGLPSLTASNGDTIHCDASVLVVDLDSRFNVNAHGSIARIAYPLNHAGWSSDPLAPSVAQLPLGSGYGPAEISANWMFPQGSYLADGSRRIRGPSEQNSGDTNSFDAFLYSGLSTGATSLTRNPGTGALTPVNPNYRRPQSSRFAPGPLPAMPNTEGRYAEGQASKFLTNSNDDNLGDLVLQDSAYPFARPGAPAQNDTLSLIRDSLVAPQSYDADKKQPVFSGTNVGVPNLWWSGTTATLAGQTVFNSPPDLHGRMITTTATATDVVPRLIFSKPEWGSAEATDDPYEIRLDPRAARGGMPITTGNSWDNVFSYADLEAILRPYDIDATQLPRRLPALLGPAAEEARLRVTTDSWDTTIITGSAATSIRTWLKNATGTLSGTSAVTGIIANEVARGERLNLNRPLTFDKPATYTPTHPYYVQRQALFKDIYTVLTMLGGTATPADRAQWAANAVEFRDADSSITPFEYDPTPSDGWAPDGDIRSDEGAAARKVVWGAERPEILIREAFSWSNTGDGSGGVVLSLHRAWNASAMARISGSNSSIAAEPCDYDMDSLASGTGGRPLNEVDLGRKANPDHSNFNDVSATTFPTWRIRIVAGGSTQYIRLDSGSAAAANEFVISPALVDGAGKPKMPVDSTLTLASTTTIKTGIGATAGSATISGSAGIVMIPNLQVTGSGTVFLERLADLSCTTTATGTVSGSVTGQDVWDADPAVIAAADTTIVPQRYIVVDQCVLPWVDTSPVPPAVSLASYLRTGTNASTAYWASPTPSASPFTISSGTTLAVPTLFSGTNAAWFVWPNRPFVSATELMLVPQGDAVGMLTTYAKPTVTANDLLTLTGTALPLFLDAVHVPSRFAGIHTTINATTLGTLAANGIYPQTTPINQISSYREPGRVNLNTVTSDDVWNAVVAGPLQVSGSAKPLVSSGTAGANFAATPAKSMLDILALASSGTAPRGDTYAGNLPMAAAKNRNPLHEFYTATRLANTATTRSNVFAIWITVRETIAGDPDSVKLHRGFYIVDRSIPVAYEPGKTHNVWDCVVLRRIIE